MPKSAVVLLIAVFVCSLGLAQAAAPAEESAVSTEEDYAILAAALNHRFEKAKPDRVLLRDRTAIRFEAAGFEGQTVIRDLANVSKEMEVNFDSRNTAQAKIEDRKIGTSFEVVLLTAEDEKKAVQSGGGCDAASPVTFASRPGLNPEHDRALMYVSTSCYGRESGILMLLGKDDRGWKVLNESSQLHINIDPPPPRSEPPSAPVTPKIVSVRQTDVGTQYLLDVSFLIPDVPDSDFETITVYGMRFVGTQRSDDKSYPTVHGHWKANDQVQFSVRVPKECADPSKGWNVTFCVGSATSCYPSPNLLTLVTPNSK